MFFLLQFVASTISLWISTIEKARERNRTSSTTGLRPRVQGSNPATTLSAQAEYFKQFLTVEEHESKAWKGLLADIRHSVGNAKRWGGDLEISALSTMFQCPIQYVTSRKVMNLRNLSL